MAAALRHADQWRAWAARPGLPTGDVHVDLSHLPPMVRRRLGPLARMAVCVADAVLEQAAQADVPVVWASRYGDAEKSLSLLRTQALGEPLSPTAFGLSVHNAIGAQHSLLRRMRANALSVASAQGVPEAGMMEVLGLLHEGADEVVLVCYDAPLPQPYACFHDEPQAEYAWAALVGRAGMGEPGFALQAAGCDGPVDEAGAGLPHGLQVLRFLVQDAGTSSPPCHVSGRWRWERVHG